MKRFGNVDLEFKEIYVPDIKKEVIVNVLESLDIQPDIRAEKLTDHQLADISNKLKHNINESQQ